MSDLAQAVARLERLMVAPDEIDPSAVNALRLVLAHVLSVEDRARLFNMVCDTTDHTPDPETCPKCKRKAEARRLLRLPVEW